LARLAIEEAPEGEVRDALGREYYARRAASGASYRNGYYTAQLDSAEGSIESSALQLEQDPDPDLWCVQLRHKTTDLIELIRQLYCSIFYQHQPSSRKPPEDSS
jgi:hypothetical protein